MRPNRLLGPCSTWPPNSTMHIYLFIIFLASWLNRKITSIATLPRPWAYKCKHPHRQGLT